MGFSCTVFMKQIEGLYWSYNGLGTDGGRVGSTRSYDIMLLSLSRLLSSDWLYPQVKAIPGGNRNDCHSFIITLTY